MEPPTNPWYPGSDRNNIGGLASIRVKEEGICIQHGYSTGKQNE
jgi:hypothetical protein